MPSTLFADVSEFQAVVDDSYTAAGYQFVSIRSNDGSYRDHNFTANYNWCRKAADSGAITGFIVYFYWRTGDTGVSTHMSMVNAAGGPHPKMVSMIDLESGGNPDIDESSDLDGEIGTLANWLSNPARVVLYANTADFYTMFHEYTNIRTIGAGYPANPNLPNQIAHQYTDGVVAPGGGLPMGAPPFGNCDMNSADNLTPADLATALGIGENDMDANQAQQLQDIHDKMMAYPGVPGFNGQWPTRARYAPQPGSPVDDTVGMILWTDANVYDLFVEFAASQGFEPAKQQIAARAKADPTDTRAVFFATKYPV